MSPCRSCHAGCCRSFAVPLTGADVLRIERDLGLPFWDFACRWQDDHGAIARNYAPHLYFADEPETPFVLCLLHADSSLFPGTRRCTFLKEEPPSEGAPLGRGECGIYGSRPGACRAFPTKWDEDGELIILYDVPSHGRPDGHEAHKLCPRSWETSDIDPIDAAADLAACEHEMSFFHKVAQLWNQQRAPWEVFPNFLRLVYGARVRRENADAAHRPEQEEELPATIRLTPGVNPASVAQPQRRAA